MGTDYSGGGGGGGGAGGVSVPTQEEKKNLSRMALFHIKIRVCLKYFLNDCLWKHSLAANSPQTPSDLIYLTILVTLRPFTKSQPKIRTTNL